MNIIGQKVRIGFTYKLEDHLKKYYNLRPSDFRNYKGHTLPKSGQFYRSILVVCSLNGT